MTNVIVGVEPEGSEQPALRWAVGYARATALLDDAELQVRRGHGDLPRRSELEDAPRKDPPEAG